MSNLTNVEYTIGQDAAAYVFAKILQRNFTAAIHSGSALLDVNSRVRFEDWFNQKAQSIRAFRKGPITVMNVVGTSLWDTCIEALPLRNENQVETLLLAEGKALSFLILNIAEPFDAHGNSRMINLAIEAAQNLMDNHDTKITSQILTFGEHRLNALQNAVPPWGEKQLTSLTIRYHLTQARLAWQQEQTDVANYYFSMVPAATTTSDIEAIFQACWRIGEQSLTMGLSKTAVTWLERSCNHLQKLGFVSELQYPNFDEWNLVIRHSIVAAHVHARNLLPQAKLKYHTTVLDTEYGEHPAVVVFNLAISKSPNFADLFHAFKQVIDVMKLTDLNMNIVFILARSLQHDSNTVKALCALLMRPLPTFQWAEKCFFALCYFSYRMQKPDEHLLKSINTVMDAMEKQGLPGLSEQTAQPCAMYIWKMGTQVLEIKDFSLAEKWALLATRSMIFEFIPIASKISLQKAFIFCSLEAGNIGQARWTLRRGVVQDQSDPEQMHLWRRLKAMEIAAGVFIQN